MYKLLNKVRFIPSSVVIRLNSINKIPIKNTSNIDNKVQDNDDDDDDDDFNLKKRLSAKDYIFSDSKSSRFKEKSPRKQKQWLKELEQRQITPKTPLSSFVDETKSKQENRIIQDKYVTPDGIINEDNFPINLDTELDEDSEEEPDEPKPLAVGGRRYPVWFYAGKLKQLASQNKVQETLDYFYKEMMDKDRVAPNLFCYQIVIGICARNGYLTQTFNLYREMKDRGFTTVDSRKMTKIFTLLATACYRASDSKMAIERATYFIDEMKTKGFRIEYRTYNALIAAFGKHGEIKMAFQLADEMAEVGFIPNEDTYVSLLIASSAEKTAGFKYAIEIWRRMLAFGVRPNAYHFGLLLNIAYNCGLGSSKSMHDLLFPPEPLQFLDDETETTTIEEKIHRGPSFLSSVDTFIDDSSNNANQQDLISSTTIENQENSTSEWWQYADDTQQGHALKNHLSPFNNATILKPNASYKQSNLVSFRTPTTPAERLMLLGGIPGVLKHMQECNVSPNHIIFNSFINLIPPLSDHEEALIRVSNICQIKPNIQFYNALIRRRLRRRAKHEALQVLDLMRDECLSPDEYTFSALAKGCDNRTDAEQLLNEMTELNLKPNQKVLEAMLNNAFIRSNFALLSLICESHKTYNLVVNKVFLERVEKFLLDIRSKILTMERAKIDTEQYRLLSSSYNRFQKYYSKWLNEVPYAKRFDEKVTFVYEKPDLKK